MSIANQRVIAEAAGVCQATVSLALRGDPSLPEKTRQRIRAVAEKLNYQSNPHVAALMAQIRTRRNSRPERGGCIALVADARDEADWLVDEIFEKQYGGMRQRAREMGFRTEVFFLRAPGMNTTALDRILRTRGIRGVVLTAQKRTDVDVSKLSWQNYACATVSYTWSTSLVDRVSAHHRHNMDKVLHCLEARGYKRIGVCMPIVASTAVESNWTAGYCVWSRLLPADRQIPMLILDPEPGNQPEFARWVKRWKPDAIVTLKGDELTWLQTMRLRVPDDIGVACFNIRSGKSGCSKLSGVEENHVLIGATVVEMVASQILRNDYGLPRQPKLVLLEGIWHEGETIQHVSPASLVL